MTLSARDLLESGSCTPQCLLGREEGYVCRCRCEGKFHGVLADTRIVIVGSPTVLSWMKWWEAIGWTPKLLDAFAPVIRTNAGAIHSKLRSEAALRGDPHVWVERTGKLFGANFDAWTVDQGTEVDDKTWETCGPLVSRLQVLLMRRGRALGATSPNTWCHVGGIQNQTEAQTVGALLRLGWAGKATYINRAIAALEST